MSRRPGVLSPALLLLVPVMASALDLAPRDVHLRAGVSLNPDQFHAGIQARIGSPLASSSGPAWTSGSAMACACCR
jgi:hypothetical protein